MECMPIINAVNLGSDTLQANLGVVLTRLWLSAKIPKSTQFIKLTLVVLKHYFHSIQDLLVSTKTISGISQVKAFEMFISYVHVNAFEQV